MKPTLKKVSKTDSQFDKLKKKEGSKLDFRNNLKTIDKKQYALEEVTTLASIVNRTFH